MATQAVLGVSSLNFLNGGISHAQLAATEDTLTFSADGASDVFLLGLKDPTVNQGAATKKYVDDLVNGLSWLPASRVATTTNGTLATAFANGQSVDGVTLATNDIILLKDQTTASENGQYVVQASGAPVRTSALPTGSNAASRATFVQEGTANADTGWVCTNDTGSAVVGTDDLSFAQFSSPGELIGGNGIDKTGLTISADVDGTSLINTGGTGDQIAIKALGVDTAELATDAVTTIKITDANVTNAKLANDSVTVTAGDGLQNAGTVALGASVTMDVDSTVLRTNAAQALTSGTKTFNDTVALEIGTDGDLTISHITGTTTMAAINPLQFTNNNVSTTSLLLIRFL